MKKKLTALIVGVMMAMLLFGCFSVSTAAAAKKSISKAVVSFTSTQTYTGKEIRPKVTVKLSGKALSSKYYTVTYKNNKKVGVASLTVTGKGSYTGSVTKSFNIVPKKVTSLKSSSDDDSITLSWKKSTGADGYAVYRYDTAAKKWKEVDKTSKAQIIVKKLSPATSYKFRIKAYFKNGKEYVYGDTVSITAATEPKKPASLKASSSDDAIRLTWKKSSGATGYVLYLYDGKTEKWNKLTATADTQYRLENLSPGTACRFRIRAYYSAEDKKNRYSDYVYIYSATKPKNISALEVSDITDTSVKLTWNKPKGAAGYKIYISEYTSAGMAGSYELYKTVKSADTTSAVIGALSGNTTYRFRIRAYFSDENCEAVYSSYAYSDECKTDISGVQGLYLSDYTNTTLTLGWTNPGKVTGYNVYLKTDSGRELIASLGSSTCLYTATGLEEDTSYDFYVVTVFTEGGESKYGRERHIEARTDDSKAEGIVFTSKASTVAPGSTYQLKAEIRPVYAANTGIVYKSSNPSVATISSSGLITAHSLGSTIITATSAENEDISESFNLTVKTVKSLKMTLPSSVTLYLGNENQAVTPAEISPTFYPTNTTDQSYSVRISDYSYKYILSTYTCKGEDYLTFDKSTGKFTTLKTTVTPKGSKEFYFTLTFTANDNPNVTATTTVRIVNAPSLKITSNTSSWTQGSTGSLTAELESNSYFDKNDLVWKSSDPNIVSVDGKGNVVCKGKQGTAKISVSSPDGYVEASYYITLKITIESLERVYFENCRVGESYQIKVNTIPKNSNDSLLFQSVNSEIATVDKNGLVTIHSEGAVSIMVSVLNQHDYYQVWFNTDECTLPEGDTKDLLYFLKTKTNYIKSTYPLSGYSRTESAVSENIQVTNLLAEGSGADQFDFKNDFIKTFLDEEIQVKTTYVNTLNANDPSFDSKYAVYLSKLPVAGNPQMILGDLSVDDIESIEVIDDGSYCYAVKMTLKPEELATLPTNGSETVHGQVFDILLKNKIDTLIASGTISNSGINSTMSYKGYKTRYHDSSITVYIHKVSGKVSSIDYDMSVDSFVDDYKCSLSYLTLSVKYTADVTFTTRHKVSIDFFG